LQKKSEDVIEASRQIIEEIHPSTVRGVCYQLFNRKLIASMKDVRTTPGRPDRSPQGDHADCCRNLRITKGGLGMKIYITAGIILACCASAALACSPSPSCWMKYGPAYIKSMCGEYAHDHRTVSEIKTYVEEPEKVGAFIAACRKVGVHIEDQPLRMNK
jgi:hypothetical protein